MDVDPLDLLVEQPTAPASAKSTLPKTWRARLGQQLFWFLFSNFPTFILYADTGTPLPQPNLAGCTGSTLEWNQVTRTFVFQSGREAGSANLRVARACKRSRSARDLELSKTPEENQSRGHIDASLQVAAAFLPGRIAASHVQVVARHLVKVVAQVAQGCGLLTDPAAELTRQLGEIWLCKATIFRCMLGVVCQATLFLLMFGALLLSH